MALLCILNLKSLEMTLTSNMLFKTMTLAIFYSKYITCELIDFKKENPNQLSSNVYDRND